MKWTKISSKILFFVAIVIVFNCRVVGHVLGNLKGMAQEMGSEIDRQNDQIVRIDDKAGVHNIHLKQANHRIERQLK